MISNQILQNTIDGLRGIARIDMCVLDTEGTVLATTFSVTEDYRQLVRDFAASPADSQAIQGHQFFKVYDEHQLEYIVMAKGESDDIYMIGKIAAFQLQNLLIAYQERFDKDNFIKNLLLDNLLSVDIFNRAKKLHIENEARRVVLIVDAEADPETNHLELIRNVYTGKNQDFITAVDEKAAIIVREIDEGDSYNTIVKDCSGLIDMLKREKLENVRIAIGTIVNEIRDVSRSYKEAKMALDIGKIFDKDKNVVSYSNLGIGRLIYQLPLPLCKMFIKETFGGKSADDFDDEVLNTINKFFENNLNVSETSRQLYIHRNTLVYRLDKLQKQTGLDLRVFEDAITFKIALMVVNYMDYMESFKY